jgi:hypothetical protein
MLKGLSTVQTQPRYSGIGNLYQNSVSLSNSGSDSNFLKHIGPKQRETIYLLFGQRARADGSTATNAAALLQGTVATVPQAPLPQQQQQSQAHMPHPALTRSKGPGWYEQLEVKGEKWKEMMRDAWKVLDHMVHRRSKFLADQREFNQQLLQYQEKLQKA